MLPRARRGRWLWGSIAFFFAVGPVLILLHLGDGLELATDAPPYSGVPKLELWLSPIAWPRVK